MTKTLLLWVSMSNFSKADVERMAKLKNIRFMLWVGGGAVDAVKYFNDYAIPFGQRIWNLRLLSRENTHDDMGLLTDPVRFANRIQALEDSIADYPGERAIDIEPQEKSPLEYLRNKGMSISDFVQIQKVIAPYEGRFQYMTPCTLGACHWYNVAQKIARHRISQSTYPSTMTASVAAQWIKSGRMCGDIKGVMVTATETATTNTIANAIKRLPDDTLFVYPTGGKFNEIADQIIQTMEAA